MSYDLDGTSDYLEFGSAVITAKPVTMAGWMYRDVSGANHSIVTIGDGDWSTGNYNQCWLSSTNDNYCKVRQHISGSFGVITGGATSYSTWEHYCGVFESSGNSKSVINGSVTSGSISNSNPTGIDNLIIGAHIGASGTRTGHVNGKVAEVALWDVALTDTQMASLAKGFSPWLISPQNLVFYAPLRGSLIDLISGTALTTYGSPAAHNFHPAIYDK